MRPYENLSGKSGVTAYQIGDTFIIVEFRDGSTYAYTNSTTGISNIEIMKRLALKGSGLSTFISRHVKDKYAEKLR
jgi:hypothetical protein